MNAKPRDAATLIIADFEGGHPKFLMGRRDKAHRFMPDAFVFPGGALDREDFSTPSVGQLPIQDIEKLEIASANQFALPNFAKALAIAALRETTEEAGLIVGHPTMRQQITAPVQHPVWGRYQALELTPCLTHLHFFARAITPPQFPKRFDARFFILDRKHVSAELPPLTQELHDLHWVAPHNPDKLVIPLITQEIINAFMDRHARGTLFEKTHPAPFFAFEHTQDYLGLLTPVSPA